MSKKILVVDAETGVRESLKLILGDHYDLILADKSEEVLSVLKNAQDVGLVLLDVKMPKVNGLELLKAIKEEFPAMKVILVTGYKSVETASEAANLGADGYIVKPFKSKDILEEVRKNV